MKRNLFITGIVLSMICLISGAQDVKVTVSSDSTFQTIIGFGGFGAKKVWWDTPPYYDQEYLNQVIDTLGCTFIRTQIYWDAEAANDNTDPNVINWSKFNFGTTTDNGKQFTFIRDLGLKGAKLMATVWTPPIWMKGLDEFHGTLWDSPVRRRPSDSDLNQNCAWCGGAAGCQQVGGWLKPEYYEEFAEYLVAYVIKVKEQTGVDVWGINIQNEPYFANPFESCVVIPDEYADILKTVGERFAAKGITTKLFGPEHMGEVTWGVNNEYIKEILEDETVNPYLSFYAVHSYVDGVATDYGSADSWTALYEKIVKTHGKELWMTETSDFEKTGYDLAFSMAKSLYLGLKFGHISGWVYWAMADYVIKNNRLTLLGRAFQQYHRFLKPGTVMIKITAEDDDLLAVAGKLDDDIVAIIINNSDLDKTISLEGEGLPSEYKIYRTSSTESFKKQPVTGPTGITLKANSITSLSSGNYPTGLKPLILLPAISPAQQTEALEIFTAGATVKPLEMISVSSTLSGTISVKDSKGREYSRFASNCNVPVKVAGATGIHTVTLTDKKGNLLESAEFSVETATTIDDGGKIGDMFRLFYKGMLVYDSDGVEEINWDGKKYRYFVNWVLDNANTAKGMQYFSPYSKDLTDLLRENQQPDGMIWSFVQPDKDDYHYYETAYSFLGYFNRGNGAWFVRQPAENHVEYNYVNMMYTHWKASGDNAWMQLNLSAAIRALDYCITDTLKWSKRFQLLKRPYCIDSWDFQVDDEYTPEAPLSPTMVVIPGKTKFGIFFGDNTGYYEACNQLAEMLETASRKEQADLYRKRANDIMTRLTELSWNGNYFTHFIDEDPSVKRNLGVDEKSQIAQGNMYSINRGLSHGMNVAIINTYLSLKQHLPAGSPGEWYAIYPPFEKGFGSHNSKWQYMNGGVAGHAAGELARGAYENGYESYASEILLKLYKLGKEHGNRIWFAYTGSIPPPPSASSYKMVKINEQANMDLWDKGGQGAFPWMNTKQAGNDMRGLPTGEQIFGNIPYSVIDPENNQRRSAIGLSTLQGFPEQAEVPVNDSAKAIYLLHASSDNIPATVAGAITFRYTDGTFASRYMMKGKDVTNWWFSSLENEYAGVAWWGPNLRSTKVGVCWVAIDNPYPGKKIKSLAFHAPLEGGIYTVLGITLSGNKHYVKPKVESFGGPDNWAAANAMAALVEGLAGVKNEGLAYDKVTLAPRWVSAGVDTVDVTVKYAASDGYIAYKYKHDPVQKKISMEITGSGNQIRMHMQLPENCRAVHSVIVNNVAAEFVSSSVEQSSYIDFNLSLPVINLITLQYN